MPELRWYGWGYADTTYSLDNRPAAWSYLKAALALSGEARFPPTEFDAIRLRPSRLDENVLGALRECVGAEYVSVDDRVRLTHSLGKSYRDLLRLRTGQITNLTDAVVWPADEDEIERLLRLAAAHQLAVVPFGGGTSVVGGVEPIGERPTLTISLARLSRVLSVDTQSQTVTAGAGIAGPALERELNARGFTLGHFPQSFEFSTLGGWIATRSAGHASGKYGKIADMVVSVRLSSPAGTIETRAVPSTAAGPSVLQLLVGSEGAFGIITRATLRVWRVPTVVVRRALLFKTFHQGVQAVRAMLQQGLKPAIVRLSDESETRTFFALRESRTGWKAVEERLGLGLLARSGHSFEHGATLILGFEGADDLVQHEWTSAAAICKNAGAVDVGAGPAKTWFRDRYRTPYLRDALMDRAILVDTLETATEWDNLEHLHDTLTAEIARTIELSGSKALVMTHISHAYRDGASLYVTLLAPMARGSELAQWESIKQAATDCIMRNGGTLTHHHAIGYEHAAWLEQEDGAPGLASLKAVKLALDPQGVMNPGKLASPLTPLLASSTANRGEGAEA